MNRLSLAELSERSEIPPRTIRYYIAQGLLPGPLNSGRSATYGDEHLRLLNKIKKMQSQGLTLAEASFSLGGETSGELAEPTSWLEYELSDDVVVRVRSGISPWRHKTIRGVLAETAAKLQYRKEEKERK